MDLKLWHSDMLEISSLGSEVNVAVSPYPRMSSCEVEVDCNCTEIMNLWESD